jgi:uncharacterized protein (DUF2147 family)
MRHPMNAGTAGSQSLTSDRHDVHAALLTNGGTRARREAQAQAAALRAGARAGVLEAAERLLRHGPPEGIASHRQPLASTTSALTTALRLVSSLALAAALLIVILPSATTASAATTPLPHARQAPAIIGLWQSVSDSIVMRIERCGDAFCGVGAGVPASKASDARSPCGRQIMNDFRWNASSGRFDGTMSPPDIKRTIRANIELTSDSRLIVRARMLLISKTMQFVPFRGTLGDGCRVEAALR